MCEISDYKKVYKFSLTLKRSEEQEIEIVEKYQPHLKLGNLYTTKKRMNHIKQYIENTNVFKLDKLVKNLPTYQYLKEWMISGLSKIEQDAILNTLLSVDLIDHFSENPEVLKKKIIF